MFIYIWLPLLILALVLLGAGYYFSRKLIYPVNRTYESALEEAIEDGILAENEWEQLLKEEISIPSPYGYTLHGFYLPNNSSAQTVIIAHGITCNLIHSVKYAKVYHRLGFNVVIYDHRNHGKSGGNNTTFGFFESTDLQAVIDWVQENKPDTKRLGIHGESMGAAIGLLATAKDVRVNFVVADCGYADLVDCVDDRARADYHLPHFPLIPLVFLWARLLTGVDLKKVIPEEAIARISVPVMIIHGEKDSYNFPYHANRLIQAAPENLRTLWLAPDAEHAESMVKNPQDYQKELVNFLREHHLENVKA